MEALQALKQCRQNFTTLVKSMTDDALQTIPKGFNNNILWNYGHSLITQQILCYKLSDRPMFAEKQWIESFAKGTLPKQDFTPEEIERLVVFSESSLQQLEKDLLANKFKQFSPYTTSYGLELRSINDAVSFNLLHENMHLGYAMAMRRVLL